MFIIIKRDTVDHVYKKIMIEDQLKFKYSLYMTSDF